MAAYAGAGDADRTDLPGPDDFGRAPVSSRLMRREFIKRRSVPHQKPSPPASMGTAPRISAKRFYEPCPRNSTAGVRKLRLGGLSKKADEMT